MVKSHRLILWLLQQFFPVTEIFRFFLVKTVSQIAATYGKNPKNSDNRKITVIILKNGLIWIFHRGMHPNNADEMANSVDPDQTAPLEIWYMICVYAQSCLSENFRTSTV